MLKITKKLTMNFKILRFLVIPTILVSTPFFNKIQDAKAALEFQWDQDSVYRRLKWFQKDDKKKLTTWGFVLAIISVTLWAITSGANLAFAGVISGMVSATNELNAAQSALESWSIIDSAFFKYPL